MRDSRVRVINIDPSLNRMKLEKVYRVKHALQIISMPKFILYCATNFVIVFCIDKNSEFFYFAEYFPQRVLDATNAYTTS